MAAPVCPFAAATSGTLNVTCAPARCTTTLASVPGVAEVEHRRQSVAASRWRCR